MLVNRELWYRFLCKIMRPILKNIENPVFGDGMFARNFFDCMKKVLLLKPQYRTFNNGIYYFKSAE